MIQLQENGKPITETAIIKLQEIIHKNPNELKTSTGFFEVYFSLLPYFKDLQSCFEYLNLMHHRKYNSYKYLSYDSFKKQKKELLSKLN
jgi:hypothetical protein